MTVRLLWALDWIEITGMRGCIGNQFGGSPGRSAFRSNFNQRQQCSRLHPCLSSLQRERLGDCLCLCALDLVFADLYVPWSLLIRGSPLLTPQTLGPR
jgi:hypothetical protein